MTMQYLETVTEQVLSIGDLLNMISISVTLVSICGIQFSKKKNRRWHYLSKVGVKQEYNEIIDSQLNWLSSLVLGLVQGIGLSLIHITTWYLCLNAFLRLIVPRLMPVPSIFNKVSLDGMVNGINILVAAIILIIYFITEHNKQYTKKTPKKMINILNRIVAIVVLGSSLLFVGLPDKNDWYILSQFCNMALIVYCISYAIYLSSVYKKYQYEIKFVNISTSYKTYNNIFYKNIRTYKDGILFTYENEHSKVIQVDINEPYTVEFISTKDVSSNPLNEDFQAQLNLLETDALIEKLCLVYDSPKLKLCLNQDSSYLCFETVHRVIQHSPNTINLIGYNELTISSITFDETYNYSYDINERSIEIKKMYSLISTDNKGDK